jgi:hypothetical protein
MLTREEVIWAFRYCLGRNPEGDQIVAKFQQEYATYKELRHRLMSEPEFISRAMLFKNTASYLNPFERYYQPALVFVHIAKTGGTSLDHLISEHFAPESICPERFNNLHLYTAAELAAYNLFSGHFDLISTRLIPRANIHRISILREPSERLISFYRFARAHPASSALVADPHFGLAKECKVEEYFENEWVRRSSLINNHYRVVFSGSSITNAAGEHDGGSLPKALDAVAALDGLGLTHRFDESVQMIFNKLSLPLSNDVKRLMSTSSLSIADDEALPSPEIELTPRLRSALSELTADDGEIFEAACREFERRWRAFSFGYEDMVRISRRTRISNRDHRPARTTK